MIAVIDYCKGNLKSVERGLRAVGADARITASLEDITHADALVLPGVGSFADASATLFATGQMQAIRDAIRRGKPFLGICLGMHLLFYGGHEGAPAGQVVEGIQCIEGEVGRMPEYDDAGTRYKIPHVGWNSIEYVEPCPLFEGIASGEYFYFTHSYIAPDTPCAKASTTHSVTFPSVVQTGQQVFGVQFHPEKSSDAGLRMLRNFVDIVDREL